MADSSRAKWRLVDSGLISPERSAATDEAILNARISLAVPDTVHFYVRDRPCVSIGHNKAVADSVAVEEVERRGVEVVRRLSGGSAVYTDRGQLIFSLILADSLLPADLKKSYSMICHAVIRGLSCLGVRADYKPINDIVVGDSKISGSAQLRRGGAVLHHGTLMVDTDLDAIAVVIRPSGAGGSAKKLTCLRDILGAAPDMQAVKASVAKGIESMFKVVLEPGRLSAKEDAEIDTLMEERYGSRSWNYRL